MSSGSACLRMRSANPSTSLGRSGGVDESRVSSIRFGNCSTVSPAAAPNAPAGPGGVAGSPASRPRGRPLWSHEARVLPSSRTPAGPGALPRRPGRVPPAYAPRGRGASRAPQRVSRGGGGRWPYHLDGPGRH